MNKKKFKPSEILGIQDPKTILHYVREWSSSLSEKEHIIKSIILEIHQNCEIRLDRIIYKLLTYCVPKGATDKDINKVEEEIWEEISKMSFRQKYRLLKPILKTWKQSEPKLSEIKNINDIRNKCAHLKHRDRILYKGFKIFSDSEGIARFFLDGWGIGKGVDDLWEWIDDQHAVIEKAVKFAHKKGAI